MSDTPRKEWFTASELAEMALPVMPATKRGVNALALRDGWGDSGKEYPQNPNGTWRMRDAGRGGGVEYHLSILPLTARTKLALQNAKASPDQAPPSATANRAGAATWEWFDALPDTKKQKALSRLQALDAVIALERSGTATDPAMMLVASQKGVSLRTLYHWKEMTYGVNRADWLPQLAPHHIGRLTENVVNTEVWDVFKGLYLRAEQPNYEACYRRLKQIALSQGWSEKGITLPSLKTLQRRIEQLPAESRILARKGEEALKRIYPHQTRDRSVFHALEAVNADGHKWDVFVKWPDGTIGRPSMIAFQDLYSGKILSFRIGRTQTKDLVLLAFGDLVEQYGIPEHCWFDNGRDFASKWLTGGVENRYRFKIKEYDPKGVMALMGIEVHWTTPYSGQSKPIERAFGDFARSIAKDPRFAGAYVGNTPLAKPENYGSHAVAIDLFEAVVAQEIAEHNSRVGRRTAVCRGRSFDATFAESYAISSIRQCGPEQRRLWLLAAEGVTARGVTGEIHLSGNRYWSEFLLPLRGKKLTIRFDPDALHEGVHVYRTDGAYLGQAPCIEAVGFADTEAARDHARARKAWLNGHKQQLEAERTLNIDALAAMLPKMPEPEPVQRPNFIKLVHGNVATKVQPEGVSISAEDQQNEILQSFGRGVSKLRLVREGGGAAE